MQSIKKLLDDEFEISVNLDAGDQDNARLKIIQDLCYQSYFEDIDDIIDRINEGSRKDEAYNIFQHYKNNPIPHEEIQDEYLDAPNIPQDKKGILPEFNGGSKISKIDKRDNYYNELKKSAVKKSKKPVKIKRRIQETPLKNIRQTKESNPIDHIVLTKSKKSVGVLSSGSIDNKISNKKRYSRGAYKIPYNVDENIISAWHKSGAKSTQRKKYYEGFFFLWISFNAFYEAAIMNVSGDSKQIIDLLSRKEILDIWGNIKGADEILCFNDYLRCREVFDNEGKKIASGGLWDCNKNCMFDDWDFGDNVVKFIFVIYRIRNNLFHGGKNATKNDRKLLSRTTNVFLFFLDEIYSYTDQKLLPI